MTLRNFIAAGTVAATLAAPSLAVAGQPAGPQHPNANANANAPGQVKSTTTSTDTTTTTTTTTTPTNAKAYGRLCQGQSKQHVKGQQGTPFSQCVKAMAQLHKGTTTSPAKACKVLSKKHVKGQKGTPYSQCVTAAAKLRKHTPQAPPTPTPSA